MAAVKLTVHQATILAHAANGLEDEQIAAELGVTRTTISTQMRTICRRFGVRTRLQAAVAGLFQGLIAFGENGMVLPKIEPKPAGRQSPRPRSKASKRGPAASPGHRVIHVLPGGKVEIRPA